MIAVMNKGVCVRCGGQRMHEAGYLDDELTCLQCGSVVYEARAVVGRPIVSLKSPMGGARPATSGRHSSGAGMAQHVEIIYRGDRGDT